MNDLAYIQPPPVLDDILRRTRELAFDMASEPRTGALLRSLAASKPDGRFLELGTGTGIATAWCLAGMSDRAELTSVDSEPAVQMVAREFLGADSRLTLLIEDGLEFLAHQPDASYDLLFADAMPGKYEGLEESIRVLRRGGFYVIDDMLPQPNWPEGHAAKIPALLSKLAGDPALINSPMSWSSGLVIAVKR
jgi:predicted O-methyltransferase YrrM